MRRDVGVVDDRRSARRGPAVPSPREVGPPRPAAPGSLTRTGTVALRTLLVPLAAGAAAWSAAERRPGPVVAATVVLLCVPLPIAAGGTDFGPGDLASVALVAVAAAALVRSRRPLSRATTVVFGSLAFGSAVATVTAHDPAAALVGWLRWMQLFVLVPVAVVVAARVVRDVRVVLGTIVGVAIAQGALGVWQYVTGSGASFGGASIRAVGSFGADDVIALSAVVGTGMVICVALAVTSAGRARALWVSTALALLVPLGLSLSRGSWIATAVAVLVVLVLAGRRTLLASLVAAAAGTTILVGGLGVGSGVVSERLTSITSAVGSPDSSVTDRYDLWTTAVGIWADHPITGAGIKSFAVFKDAYAPLGLSAGSDVEQAGAGFARQALLSPHNEYLLVLSEQGVVGAVAFVALVVAVTVGCVLALRSCPVHLRGPGLAVTGLMVWQAVQFLYGDLGGPTSLLTSVSLGLAAWWAFETRRPPVVATAAAAPAAEHRPAPAPAPDTAAASGAPASPAPPTSPQASPPSRARPPGPSRAGRGIARAAALSAALAAAGSLLGLVRDLLVAAFFGATAETDAFLVAWTVPETIAPLLIEGAMAFVLVPAFGRALEAAELRRETSRILHVPSMTDPVRELIESTALRILLALAALGAVVAATSPWLIAVLAPGLADPALAALCMRVVAVTIPLLGAAGYLAAALRTHHVFAAPAAIYLAYNVGIVGLVLTTHDTLGVLGAAVGIAVGALLMVLVQVPSAIRRLPWPRLALARNTTLFAFAAVLPVVAYTLSRQAQTFVERFAGSALPEGTISHLNYAQKVAQIPITLSFMAAAVTFPIFARSVAAGRQADARRRMETDLLVVGTVALVVSAYLIVFAPSVVATLFEHGAFTAADTADTVAILRVYVVGLLGQAIVNLLVRPYYTYGGRVWFPAVAMVAGLAATVAATVALIGPLGAAGVAGANAIGITLTAALLAAGSGARLPVAPAATAYRRLAAIGLPAAAASAAAGVALAGPLSGLPAPVEAVAGGVVVVAVTAAVVVLTATAIRPRSAGEAGRT